MQSVHLIVEETFSSNRGGLEVTGALTGDLEDGIECAARDTDTEMPFVANSLADDDLNGPFRALGFFAFDIRVWGPLRHLKHRQRCLKL